MRARSSLLAAPVLTLLAGCGDCAGVTPDGGVTPVADGGVRDAGEIADASMPDAASIDADGGALIDGGVMDASVACPSACGVNARCELVQGEPACVCNPGFTGDGATCEDVDECQGTPSPCATEDVCRNIPGGHFCACGPGQVYDGDACRSVGQRRLGAGAEHACRIDALGAMKCWGLNHHGQLGDGTTTRRSVMTPVAGGHVWRSVSVFRNTTCAIDTDGGAWCWGEVTGLLVVEASQAEAPAQASAFTDWEQLSLGDGHICGIRPGGALHCWGLNASGQLGEEPPQWSTANAPFEVQPGQAWATVSAGSSYTCGVKLDGTLWCWGNNLYGNLGDGSLDPDWNPTQVGTDVDWRTVEAGPFFATCAIKLDGSLWCWGQNTYGQVGSGASPVTSPEELESPVGFRSVDMGSHGVCGTHYDGSVWCRGRAIGPALVPTDAASLAALGPVSDVATSEPGAVGLAYPTFSCALTSDDAVRCWGQNNDGELALGSFGNKSEPARVGDETWAHAEPGAGYTCGLRQDGTLWCWGMANVVLPLLMAPGNPGVTQVPAQVDPAADWLSLSVGAQSLCGIKTDRGLWCAGSGFTPALEQVGSNTSWTAIDLGRGNYVDDNWLRAAGTRDPGTLWTFNEYLPLEGEQLGADDDWDEVAIAREHACGRRGGALWCWYQDAPNDPMVQVGSDTDWTLVRSSPELVGINGTIPAASWGVRDDGTLWEWTMSAGQPITLTQRGVGIEWQTLDVGLGLICGVARDGSLWCWGAIDLARAVSTRELVAAPDPLRIGEDMDWAQVKIGNQLVVAWKTDHSLWSWGYGPGGELGHGDAWRSLPGLAQ